MGSALPVIQLRWLREIKPISVIRPGDVMHFYHHGVAIEPWVAIDGNIFVARVSILEEDGETTSLGDLGYFANRQSAFAFAVRCGTAFVDKEPMPRPPCDIRSS
jgi:hypothetical protein